MLCVYYSETSDQREKVSKQVRFNDKVSQDVFNKSKGSKRCIDNVESCPLLKKMKLLRALLNSSYFNASRTENLA